MENSTTIQIMLQELLDDYQTEKAESQAANDTRFVEYWEGSRRTIYDVALALGIPLEDSWVDPSYVRSVEYEVLTRKERRQRRKREIAGDSHAS